MMKSRENAKKQFFWHISGIFGRKIFVLQNRASLFGHCHFESIKNSTSLYLPREKTHFPRKIGGKWLPWIRNHFPKKTKPFSFKNTKIRDQRTKNKCLIEKVCLQLKATGRLPFPIAVYPKVKGIHSFFWISPLTFDPSLQFLSIKQRGKSLL